MSTDKRLQIAIDALGIVSVVGDSKAAEIASRALDKIRAAKPNCSDCNGIGMVQTPNGVGRPCFKCWKG